MASDNEGLEMKAVAPKDLLSGGAGSLTTSSDPALVNDTKEQ